MRIITSLVAVAAVGLVVGLVACGDDDEEPTKPKTDAGPDTGEEGGSAGSGGNDEGAGADSKAGKGGESDDEGGGGSDGEEPDPYATCAVLTPTKIYDYATLVNNSGTPVGKTFIAYASPSVDDEGKDEIQFQFIGDPAAGTFDLPAITDAAGKYWVQVESNIDKAEANQKLFLHKKGKVEIKAGFDMAKGFIEAKYTDLVLVQSNPSTGAEVANGKCLKAAEIVVKVEAKTGWDCFPGYYEDGQCDCDCGGWDKDCDPSTGLNAWDDTKPKQFVVGCAPKTVCLKGGTDAAPTASCTDGKTWTCAYAAYGSITSTTVADADKCDCGCGAYDPDCEKTVKVSDVDTKLKDIAGRVTGCTDAAKTWCSNKMSEGATPVETGIAECVAPTGP